MSIFTFFLPDTTSTPAPTTVPSGSIDHVTAAVNRLCEQFKKQNIINLLSILVGPAQDLETALWDLFTKRGIYTAFGVQLDAIGKLVGQARNGQDDATYQRYIIAKVSVNSSGAVPDDLLAITTLIINDSTVTLTYENTGIAAYTITAGTSQVATAVAAIVGKLLNEATGAGIRGVFHYLNSTSAAAFTLRKTAFITTPVIVGDTILHVTSTDGYPNSGSLDIGKGMTTQEAGLSYTSRTANTFTLAVAAAQAHPANTAVGLNLGDPTNSFYLGLNLLVAGVESIYGGKFSSAVDH